MKTRRVISLTALLSFILLSISGILLFVSPQGRVAYWSGWTLFGLTKDEYSAVHQTFMVLFLVVGVWHIVLNWRPITGYLKNRSRQVRLLTPESGVAMAVAGVFVAGPLLGVFPFRQFLNAGEDVKAYWEASSGSPPWGHAEENSLARFCRGLEDFERLEAQRLIAVDCDAALEAMHTRGLAVASTRERLIDIAEANGTTPQALAAIVMSVSREVSPEEAAARLQPPTVPQRFQRPYSGLGRMTLSSYAEKYGYALSELQSILSEAGYGVNPEATLRDEADRLGTNPEGLIDILNGERDADDV